MSDTSGDLPPIKKRTFVILTFILVVVCLEAISFLGLSIAMGQIFSRQALLVDQGLIIESSGQYDPRRAHRPGFMRREIVHPYVGYVLDNPTPEDPFGFANSVSPVQERDTDKVIIAITGGSVAYQMFDDAIDRLVSVLEASPAYSGKELVAIRLAAGGYKQPQQFMILSYLLSLGAEFDLLVNLDGFNEAELALENAATGVAPFYPRGWQTRIDVLSDLEMFRAVSDVFSLRSLRVRQARFFASGILAHSFTLNFLWKSADYILQSKLNDLDASARDLGRTATSFAATGPQIHYSDERELINTMVEVWKASSLNMKTLADAHGFRYFHFLQPNQYVPGSKPLSDAEISQAFNDVLSYKSSVEKVYPHLISSGHELLLEGVEYRDLTEIFSENRSTLYVDVCCHLNETGYELIADEIAATILNNASTR